MKNLLSTGLHALSEPDYAQQANNARGHVNIVTHFSLMGYYFACILTGYFNKLIL